MSVDSILDAIRKNGSYPVDSSTTDEEYNAIAVALAFDLIKKDGNVYRAKKEGYQIISKKISFDQYLKGIKNQHRRRKITKISEMAMTAAAIIIAGLSYWNERTNSSEIRELVQINIDRINGRVDSIGRLYPSFSIKKDQTTYQIDTIPKEIQADSNKVKAAKLISKKD